MKGINFCAGVCLLKKSFSPVYCQFESVFCLSQVLVFWLECLWCGQEELCKMKEPDKIVLDKPHLSRRWWPVWRGSSWVVSTLGSPGRKSWAAGLTLKGSAGKWRRPSEAWRSRRCVAPKSLSSRSAPLRPRRWVVVTQVGMVTNAINIVVCWHFHKDLALRGLGYLSALFLVQNFQEKWG